MGHFRGLKNVSGLFIIIFYVHVTNNSPNPVVRLRPGPTNPNGRRQARGKPVAQVQGCTACLGSTAEPIEVELKERETEKEEAEEGGRKESRGLLREPYRSEGGGE